MHLDLAPPDLTSDADDLLAETLMRVFHIHSTHPQEAVVQLSRRSGFTEPLRWIEWAARRTRIVDVPIPSSQDDLVKYQRFGAILPNAETRPGPARSLAIATKLAPWGSQRKGRSLAMRLSY